jgi:hypothetical protein
LDRELTPKLRSLYPDFNTGPLASDQLFPVYWPNLKHNGWFPPDKLSSQPASMPQPPGFISKWGLAPHPEVFSGRQVEFVFPSRTDVTPSIPGPLKVGVGVLNAETTQLTWDLEPDPPRFWNVRPHPDIRDAQVAAMCRISTLAANQGVSILVFPELCVDRPGAEEVFNHVAGLKNRPALVIIGSHHWFDGNHRLNTCIAIRSGSPPFQLRHDKMARYTHYENGQSWQEDIHPGAMIRVYVSTDWSVILLICRDFLDTSARKMVETLRPTFLCLPSFATTTDPFVNPAGAITTTTQTVVVFANGPVPKDSVVGFFGVPRRRESPGTSASLSREVVILEPLMALPCLIIYDGMSDLITLLPC